MWSSLSATQQRSGRLRTSVVAWSALVVALASGCAAGLVNGSGSVASSSRSTPAPSTRTVTVTPSASPTRSFASIYAQEQSGVVRIETVSCTYSGIGSGFLLSPTLVLTVNHVIDQSVAISLVDGRQRTSGTVIGADPTHDLALVRAAQPISGFHFALQSASPQVGDPVGVIGFPIGGPITFTGGSISGLDRNITLDNGVTLDGLLQTDASINPGNSGGPVLTTSGQVVGLIDAKETDASGIGFAVPAPTAAGDVARWRVTAQPPAPASCSNPLGPSQDSVTINPPTGLDPAVADGIVTAFEAYFNGIDSGDYRAAFDVLSPRLRGNTTLSNFASGDSTSYDFDVEVLDATQHGSDSASVSLTFVSIQSPNKGPNGDTCDIWTLTYAMSAPGGSTWYIDGVTPFGGREHTSC